MEINKLHCTSCSKPVSAPYCQGFAERWSALIPKDYRHASPQMVPRALAGVLEWRPSVEHLWGMGVIGKPGKGKTNALALLALYLHTPFRWVTGGSLRAAYNDTVNLDGEARQDARRKFRRYEETPILIVDDILEAHFTEAWREALFDLLEKRNSAQLMTCWSAQHGPGEIGVRIGDRTGEAIERRLCQRHRIFEA